ncbi:hypothetical protein QJS10_CPA16g00438 [Acorus calamus]|uniref:Uncharacterized protein n=1 Tax=Acorus calamus TaxID=4465 RepID=A0AAV9CZL9_ACOCL|nr:hypothetical protein QJS10_CPA16g00438 [Acorus calamus]
MIPKDILLHLLGHSKVNKEAIKKIMNFTVAEFVNKSSMCHGGYSHFGSVYIDSGDARIVVDSGGTITPSI